MSIWDCRLDKLTTEKGVHPKDKGDNATLF
jgi:hypothetical protein